MRDAEGIALWLPLCGIALDNEIAALDIAQAAQLPEKRPPRGSTLRFGDAEDGEHRSDHRDPVLLRLLLRECRERPRDSGAAEDQEFAPVQPFTSSLRAISRTNLPRYPSAYQREC
jgi:hypothetical protein